MHDIRNDLSWYFDTSKLKSGINKTKIAMRERIPGVKGLNNWGDDRFTKICEIISAEQ